MDKGLEVLKMSDDERKEFRKTYGYEIYEESGDFDELVLKYEYDKQSKKLVKR